MPGKHHSIMSQARGAFILFEGCDRAGKSTQVKLLSEYLTSVDIKHKTLRFPSKFYLIVKDCPFDRH
jgi:thymidylate kinase